jgi:hypothetical protein
MKRFKYIMLNEVYPIVFGEYFKHSDIVENNSRITSAGFGNLFVNDKNELEVSVYGESISLKKKSNPLDAKILLNIFVDDW